MTRPTPVKNVAPFVLDILRRAGLKRDHIRFIWALGSHGAYDMINARKNLAMTLLNSTPFIIMMLSKLSPCGPDAVGRRSPVQPGIHGLRFENRHRLHHSSCSRGLRRRAKIILPGVAGIETINQFTAGFTPIRCEQAWAISRITSCAPEVRRRPVDSGRP